MLINVNGDKGKDMKILMNECTALQSKCCLRLVIFLDSVRYDVAQSFKVFNGKRIFVIVMVLI
jgi:hypothetical protein